MNLIKVRIMGISLIIIFLFLILPKGSLIGYLSSGFLIALGVSFLAYSRFSRLRVSEIEAGLIIAPLLILASYSILRALFGVVFLAEQPTLSIFLDPYRYVLFVCFFLLGKGCQIGKDYKLHLFLVSVLFANLFVVILQKVYGAAFYIPFTMRGIESINSNYLTRAVGTIGNPNILAIFIAAPFLLGLYRLKEKFNLKDLFLVVGGGLILIIAQSRSTLVYTLIVLILFIAINRKIKVDPIFLICAVIASYFIYQYVTNLIADGGLGYLVSGYTTVMDIGLRNQSSVAARLDSWNDVISLMFSGSTTLVFGLGYAVVNNKLGAVDNAYLYGFSKYGIFYLLYFVSFATIFFTARVNKYSTKNIYNYFLLSMLMLLVSAMSGDVLENVVLVGVVFFLSGVINSYSRRDLAVAH